MSKEPKSKFHQLLGKELLKQLPLSVRLVDPIQNPGKSSDGISKVRSNKFYKEQMLQSHRFHKPISKILNTLVSEENN